MFTLKKFTRSKFLNKFVLDDDRKGNYLSIINLYLGLFLSVQSVCATLLNFVLYLNDKSA